MSLAFIVTIGVLLWPKPPPLVLHLFISPDAWNDQGEGLANQAIDEFNVTHPIRLGDQVVEIAPPQRIASGKAKDTLREEPSAADVWVPASTVWGSLLNEQRNDEVVSLDAPGLVWSPQVIAMWTSDVERLKRHGYPDVGWREILHFATKPRAWGMAVGRSTDRFRLVHTNPVVSTSGLSAAISEFSTASNTVPSGLTGPIVDRYAHTIHRIELSVVHYGDTANDLMKQLACFGSSYASAVYVQEQSVIDFNDPAFTEKAGCANDRRHDTLTPIAPSGGTFVADYPCYALARPEASAESTAAALFCSWLADWFKKAPGVVAQFHFRSYESGPPEEPDSLEPPSARVMDHVQEIWRKERKPASFMIAIDTSATMGEERLNQIKDEVASCLLNSLGKDRVGLIAAGGAEANTVALSDLDGGQLTDLRDGLARMRAADDDALWDGIWNSVRMVREGPRDARIRAVVVLTDGTDGSDTSFHHWDELEGYLKEKPLARVFFVTYGSNADTPALEAVKDASQGRIIPSVTSDGDICQAVFDYF